METCNRHKTQRANPTQESGMLEHGTDVGGGTDVKLYPQIILKYKLLCFHNTKMSHLYLHREQVLQEGAAMLYHNSNSERINFKILHLNFLHMAWIQKETLAGWQKKTKRETRKKNEEESVLETKFEK